MSNNSATGGYLKPTTPQLPGNLTFTQFLQTVLVGISGFDGTLVRPEWQPNPPKQPDNLTNWLAFGVLDSDAKGFPYQEMKDIGTPEAPQLAFVSQYHEKCSLKCDLYGPDALENYRLIRDGFYLPLNNEALVSAGFGLIGVGKAIRNPDLVGEVWFNRYVFSIDLMYQQNRTYPILTFMSGSGVVYAPLSHNADFQVPWLVPPEEI